MAWPLSSAGGPTLQKLGTAGTRNPELALNAKEAGFGMNVSRKFLVLRTQLAWTASCDTRSRFLFGVMSPALPILGNRSRWLGPVVRLQRCCRDRLRRRGLGPFLSED